MSWCIIGDSLTDHAGQKFSTMDQDNDVCSCSCAAKFKGAWWYKKCYLSNLNGQYIRGQHNSNSNGIEWVRWKGNRYSLKISEMKIRPVNA